MTDHRDELNHQTALTRRFFLGISAVAALAPAMIALRAVPARAASKPKVFTGLIDGVGAGGYDVVAYFTQGAAVPGDAAITAQHDGATWRFTSAENRDTFLADPAKYAPQYGGYCAYAASKGATASGDPQAWTVHEGKLYLNYSTQVRSIWSGDKPGNIAKADANWPRILE